MIFRAFSQANCLKGSDRVFGTLQRGWMRQMLSPLFLVLALSSLFITVGGVVGETRSESNRFESLEQKFEHAMVEEVSFQSSLNLSSEDLMSSVTLRPGDQLKRGELSRTVEKLMKRQIFDNIDVQILPLVRGEDGALPKVRVEFLLTPIVTIGEVRFRGNRELAEGELRRISGLRLGTEMRSQALEDGVERVRKAYIERGFFDAEVRIELLPRSQYSQVTVVLRVSEGEQYSLRELRFEGEIPKDVATQWEERRERWIGRPVAKAELRAVVQSFLVLLRSEGYLQASVLLREQLLDRPSATAAISLQITPRTPLTISFAGNTVFSAEELLSPLQLESRAVPFSPNAIGSLCEQIEEMYQRSGYFFVDASFALTEERDDRRFFTVTIKEGAQLSLDKLVIVGNTHLSDEEIQGLMVTKEAGPLFTKRWLPGYLVRKELAEDLARIEELYDQRGFSGTKASFDLLQREDSRSAKLVIIVSESEVNRIERIEFVDELGQELSAPQRVPTPLKEGAPLDIRQVKGEETRLREELYGEGYPNASVAGVIEGRVVRFQLSRGAQVTIGEIVLQGNKVTHDEVILRELKISPGVPWNPTALDEATERLLRTGIFSGVSLRPEDGVLDEATEELAVVVEERDTGTLNLETTFNTEDGLHLNGEVTQRNFRGYGNSLTVGVDGYYRSTNRLLDAGRARVLYNDRTFLDTEFKFVTEAFAQYSISLFEEYRYNRVGYATLFQRELSPRTLSDVGLTMYTENVYHAPPDLEIGTDDLGTTFYSLLRASTQYDRRNDRFNPREGFLVGLQSELSSAALGSEVNLYSLTAHSILYYPVTSKLLWSGGARATLSRPYGDTDVVPLSSRIFLGGRNSLRGYSRGAVGPRSEEGNIVGGDTVVNFTTELQRDITDSIAGVIFLDAGQSVLEHKGSFDGDNSNLWSLRYSPGFGMRYKTPIGPVSLDWGFATDREYGERWGRISFGIGGAFY